MTNTARIFELPAAAPVVDRLGHCRAVIRELQEIEKQLKVDVGIEMGSHDRVVGHEYLAIQSISERKGGIDEAAIMAALDVDTLDGFRKPATAIVTIRTEALK